MLTGIFLLVCGCCLKPCRLTHAKQFLPYANTQTERHITSKKDAFKMHSIIHFYLSAYIFQAMLQYAWYPSKLIRELNRRLPKRWIGCAGRDDSESLHWPPRALDLTPCYLFIWFSCQTTRVCHLYQLPSKIFVFASQSPLH